MPERLSRRSICDRVWSGQSATSCQLDLPVSLAASNRLAWPNSVTNKPARQSLRHYVGVQYPGRMHWQQCVILYIFDRLPSLQFLLLAAGRPTGWDRLSQRITFCQEQLPTSKEHAVTQFLSTALFQTLNFADFSAFLSHCVQCCQLNVSSTVAS